MLGGLQIPLHHHLAKWTSTAGSEANNWLQNFSFAKPLLLAKKFLSFLSMPHKLECHLTFMDRVPKGIFITPIRALKLIRVFLCRSLFQTIRIRPFIHYATLLKKLHLSIKDLIYSRSNPKK